jgi:hypothetical protein
MHARGEGERERGGEGAACGREQEKIDRRTGERRMEGWSEGESGEWRARFVVAWKGDKCRR